MYACYCNSLYLQVDRHRVCRGFGMEQTCRRGIERGAKDTARAGRNRCRRRLGSCRQYPHLSTFYRLECRKFRRTTLSRQLPCLVRQPQQDVSRKRDRLVAQAHEYRQTYQPHRFGRQSHACQGYNDCRKTRLGAMRQNQAIPVLQVGIPSHEGRPRGNRIGARPDGDSH